MFSRCIILVADGAREDLFRQLLEAGRLPNIHEHIVERGCYRKALTVFPSTTGPAHIPFVSGQHPGTANVPGYRWLCRQTHDTKRRSIYRHRSLNSPRGLVLGRDMNTAQTSSLYQYFEKPSSVLELVDYCPDRPLHKLVVRRLVRIVRAHQTDDWSQVDNLVERQVLKRIRAGSECIIGSFFGIDEYSHLYSPTHEKTIAAYENIDRALGGFVEELKVQGTYDDTILAIVSDHGLTATDTHIPVVDIVKAHGFKPYYYPRVFRRKCDSAVMESGNAMAQLYFKRNHAWGAHWRWEEMQREPRIKKLLDDLISREGMSFVCARANNNGIVIAGRKGLVRAERINGVYEVTIEGLSPLGRHPIGRFTPEKLYSLTYEHEYPDAVNQVFMLFASPRSGDVALSSEPAYDLRWQHEDPEHQSSHGSLHREHMHVPLAFSVPFEEDQVSNYDLVPTILALTGKRPRGKFDGRTLTTHNGSAPPAAEETAESADTASLESRSSIWITVGLMLFGLALVWLFGDQIEMFGKEMMTRVGQEWVDLVLLMLTAVSSTPLMLPIWGYALVGVALGYAVPHLAIVMAVGSALGSFVTFWLGRRFAQTEWVRRKFPNLHNHPWTRGKSKRYVTLMLFLGTASPVPCDVFYVACGAKRFPGVLFLMTMIAARFVRYLYIGYGFDYFGSWF